MNNNLNLHKKKKDKKFTYYMPTFKKKKKSHIWESWLGIQLKQMNVKNSTWILLIRFAISLFE